VKKHIESYDSEAGRWVAEPLYKLVLLAMVMLAIMAVMWVKEKIID